MPDRVFVDANVLFSASYRVNAPLARLWNIKDIRIVTSTYALGEALRNAQEKASDEHHTTRLEALLAQTEITHYDIEPGGTLYIQTGINLPDKDWPILLAAIDASCTHLLTGDATHFGHLFGLVIEGCLILRPGEYLRAMTND